MSTLPLAEVKARLSAVLEEIARTHERVVVTRNGRPEVVSIDDLAASMPGTGSVLRNSRGGTFLTTAGERARRAVRTADCYQRRESPCSATLQSSRPVVEFALGPLRRNPHRVGKPLRGEQTGRSSGRRGTYRLICEIDEENRIVRVLHADHRSDVYRPR